MSPALMDFYTLLRLTAAGRKRCELRKTRIRGIAPHDRVWIYATKPVGKIVCGASVSKVVRFGRAEIEHCIEGWVDHEYGLAMTQDEFRDYAGDHEGDFTFVLWASIFRLEEPVALPRGMTAPQFYKKIDARVDEKILKGKFRTTYAPLRPKMRSGIFAFGR